MLLFFFVIVASYEIHDLAACLNLVKWKIDKDEDLFDTMLASSDLSPESLIDKIVGDMLESCAEQITPAISKELLSAEPFYETYNGLLDFTIKTYKNFSELELSDSQILIFEALEKFVESQKETNYSNWYLIISFSAVIIFVAISRFSESFNPKKWFKLE